MSQQNHSSEITVTIDDSQVRQAAERLSRSLGKVGEDAAKAFDQADRAAKRAAPVAAPVAAPPPPSRAPLDRDERGRFIPRGAKPPAPRLSGGLTALEQFAGGDPNSALNDMGAAGRAVQAAGRARALAIANAYRPPPSLGARALAFGGTVAGAAPSMFTSGAQAIASGGAGDAFRAGGAAAGSLAGAFGLSRIAGGLPIIGGLAGALLQRRGQRIGQVSALERPQTELALGGAEGVRGARSRFARLGISGAEGVGSLRSFQRAIGARSELLGADSIGYTADFLAQASLRGIDPSSIGAFVGGGALGGGARGGTFQSAGRANQVLGAATSIGLTGSGATRFLAAIAQNTQRIAAEGLSIDETSASRFILGIDAAAKQTGRNQLRGTGAVRTFQKFGGAIGGVAGAFRGQFGGLASGALTAAAARGGGGPLDVMRRLEGFRSAPETAVAALRGIGLEGDLLQIALSGLGLSTDEADTLARAGQKDLGTGLRGEGLSTMRRGMRISRTAQSEQERILRRVEADPASAQAFIKLNTRMEELALTMTTTNSVLVKSMQGIEGRLKSLLEFVDSGNFGTALRDILREVLF